MLITVSSNVHVCMYLDPLRVMHNSAFILPVLLPNKALTSYHHTTVTKSSCVMKSDIIVEGFRCSEIA